MIIRYFYPFHQNLFNDNYQVGAAKFVADNAPSGMLATVTGLQGGAHNGLGKGFGGLLGGITIETTKSTHKAFWLFGVACAGISVVYIALTSLIHFRHRNNEGKEKETNRRIKREHSGEEIEKESYEKNDEQKVAKDPEEKETFLEDGGDLSD